MLNLVQIQDKLKDMPMQAVMAYANGQNPMVPPYLALGELNRRKGMERAAMAEQAKQEPPTIKQATEQELGLMNLQKQKAMMAQQNMGQAMANAPSPVPAGIGEAPVQMAGGGLTRLPVRNFRRDAYACGGIVAFADGGVPQLEVPEKTSDEAELQRLRKIQELAGVKGLYGEEQKALYDAIQQRRQQEREGSGMGQLISFLTGISKAKPQSGFGVALGGGAEEQQKTAKEQAALQDKQDMDMAALQGEIANKRRAEAMGDAKGAIEATEKINKLRNEVMKDQASMESTRITAEASKQNAAANTIQAQTSRDRVAIEAGVREDTRLMTLYKDIYATNIKAAQDKLTGRPLTEQETDAIAQRSMKQAQDAALQFYGKPSKGAEVKRYDKDGKPI